MVYNTDDIRAAADCRDLIKNVLGGNEREPGKFDCPWRAGSDSGAVKVERDKWYDHVAKEGGDAFNMIMLGKNMNFIQASEWLGDHYHLTPKESAKANRKEVKQFLCEYIYTDYAGAPLHKKIRYIPKSFSQSRYEDGEWETGLNGITPVLYNLPAVKEAIKKGEWIFIPEGEKDADNICKFKLCATTQTMGAGKWKRSYNDALVGANVCLIVDKDKAGRDHRRLVAPQLVNICNSLKVIEMDGEDVKDFTDWKEAGGTAEQFKQIVEDAPAYNIEDYKDNEEPEPESVEKPARTKAFAKECNKKPFSNFTFCSVQGPDGTSQTVKKPLQINVLTNEILDRFMGFPRRVSGRLFDHDKDTGKIKIIKDSTALFSWIQVKSNQLTKWTKVEGAVSQEQVFYALKSAVKQYNVISGVPTFPIRKDAYYTYKSLPEPDKDKIHLETFLNFFNPANEASKLMLRAFVASPLYYKPKVDRPLWVIDSDTAQGSGKTKLVEAVARLYGSETGDEGEPFWVNVESIKNEQSADKVWKRLLSSDGRRKRVVLIDNVIGFLKAPSLATLVTQGSISGLAPYGRGEETRPNDLTYAITSNSASFDRDLADRSIFIKVNRKENADPLWAEKVFKYIDNNRLNILSEIVDTLEKVKGKDPKTYTRFRTWEVDVMAPMIGNEEQRAKAMGENIEMQKDCDYDQENAEEIRKFFAAKIELRYGKDAKVFLPNPFIKSWFQEALPDENIRKGMIPKIIQRWAQAGLLPEINISIRKTPDKVHGFAWNVKSIAYGDWKKISVYQDYVV